MHAVDDEDVSEKKASVEIEARLVIFDRVLLAQQTTINLELYFPCYCSLVIISSLALYLSPSSTMRCHERRRLLSINDR